MNPADFLQRLGQEHTQQEQGRVVISKLEQGSREAYRWARRDRRTQDFMPLNVSGDRAIYESHELMHARVRDQVLNNAQATRIIDALTDLVVGTGVQTFSSPFNPALSLDEITIDSLDEGLRFALESDDVFEEWSSDEKQFDAERKQSWHDIQRLAFRENCQVGSVLLLRCMRQSREIPLCYQVIERDQLDCTKDRPASRGRNRIVNGVELDSNNQEVAFHIYDAHPYDDFTPFASLSGKSSRVSANRVIHLFLFKRPSQSLGATWLHAIGQSSFDRDKFIGNEIATAAKVALLAMIFKRKNPYQGTLGLETSDTTADDAYGNTEVRLGTSPVAAEVGLDESVEMIESNRPTATADRFIDLLDHDIAGGTGISYYTLTGKFDKTNYTGFRGALLSEDDHIRPLQQWFARKVVLPVRREFNQMAAASGLLSTVRPSQFEADRRRYQRFDAIGPGRQFLDPEKETEASLGKLRGGLTTLKIECARQGLHWVKVLRQQAVEARYAEALGIVLDFSKGEGGKIANAETQEAETDET